VTEQLRSGRRQEFLSSEPVGQWPPDGDKVTKTTPVLAQAIAAHEAGRLAEAESLCRAVLEESPNHLHALHLLGMLAEQRGRSHEAVALIKRGLEVGGPHPVFHSNLASVYLGVNQLADAEKHAREALRLKLDYADAWSNLGIALHRQGKWEEAIALIAHSLAIGRPNPVSHSNLAAVYLDVNQFARAEKHAREALRLKPDYADAFTNLGIALHRQGKWEEAADAFTNALRCNPRHIEAHCGLGAVRTRQGRLREALTHLQETVRLAPNHSQARNNLGGVLLELGWPEQALEHLREAIRLRPTFADAHGNLGVALHELNLQEEAVSCFHEVLRLSPRDVTAHNYLAATFAIRGSFDLAVAQLREALALEPANAVALASLVNLEDAEGPLVGPAEIAKLRELCQENPPAGDQGKNNQAHANFALATVLDRAGQVSGAFKHYQQANRLRKEYEKSRGMIYDPAAHHDFVDRLLAVFTVDYFQRVASWGSGSTLPMFIVGMPRSGTTLAEQILASHPQVHGAGELRDVPQLVLHESLADGMVGLDKQKVEKLAENHLRKIRQLGGKVSRVIDKMPFNFLHLGVIATLFPKARIIHCHRNALDTCLSCFFHNFGPPHPFSWDLKHLGHYYREYERLMAHWKTVLPLETFELNYEELTADQEAISRRLVAFCGLEWDERCLKFYQTERAVRTSSLLQVRKPMYRNSVGRWKRYEAYLAPLLAALEPDHSERESEKNRTDH
jgi:Flp pilus assembly protein TadD